MQSNAPIETGAIDGDRRGRMQFLHAGVRPASSDSSNESCDVKVGEGRPAEAGHYVRNGEAGPAEAGHYVRDGEAGPAEAGHYVRDRNRPAWWP
jgi:hypothetical protein